MKELKRLFNNYSWLDILRLSRDLILTKIFFPAHIRLIRQPSYIIGKKHIKFGKNFNSGVLLRIEVLDKSFLRHPLIGVKDDPKLVIGDNVNVNFNVHIGVLKRVEIGNNVLIGSNVLIIDHNHGNYKLENQDNPFSIPKDRQSIAESIKIGNNVWIGENVCVLPGTIVGDGCIIGANTVLNGIYKKNQIIVGSPSRPIKEFNITSKTWEAL